jgi:hypothetical protein
LFTFLILLVGMPKVREETWQPHSKLSELQFLLLLYTFPPLSQSGMITLNLVDSAPQSSQWHPESRPSLTSLLAPWSWDMSAWFTAGSLASWPMMDTQKVTL